jgi:S-adenosylmethionine:tRNA ribosyltransferase-isomerase
MPTSGTLDEHTLDAYDFDLPRERIAQHPASRREDSRLLHLDTPTGDVTDHGFTDFASLLTGDEILVVNDTRVLPARLITFKESGGRVELLLLPRNDEDTETMARCMARSNNPLAEGMALRMATGAPPLRIVELLESGRVRVDCSEAGGVADAFGANGSLPLPPYIEREDGPTPDDEVRYQTIFARRRGAVAAPTAGLHFTARLVRTIQERGVPVIPITLHVGPGTFQPVRTPDLRAHQVESEWVRMGPVAANALNKARGEGRRIIAVGTTVVRTLESLVAPDGSFAPRELWTDLTIRPGHVFGAVDGLLTNFHLPRSSLLVLVATFAGREKTLAAYRHAVASSYRFYSYGDAMLIR